MSKIKNLSILLCLYFATSCGGSNTINDIQTLEQKVLEIPPNFELKPPSDNENVLSQEITLNEGDSSDVEDILNSDSSSTENINDTSDNELLDILTADSNNTED
jgi:hypothetical protein